MMKIAEDVSVVIYEVDVSEWINNLLLVAIVGWRLDLLVLLCETKRKTYFDHILITQFRPTCLDNVHPFLLCSLFLPW
jgi:hypothetical protein